MDNRTHMIKLSQISNKFDSRVAMDQDRVVQLAGMYESGIELPPIKLVKLDEESYAFIDGRHRAAARSYLGMGDVPAKLYNGSLRENPVRLFAESLSSNWGGSKPPSREDITHTITRMIEFGGKEREILELLNFLPKGAAHAYIASAKGKLTRRRTCSALDLIRDGKSLDEAAKEVGIKKEMLADVIGGKKRIFRSERSDYGIHVKAGLSTGMASLNKGTAKKLSNMFKMADDGEITVSEIESVLLLWEHRIDETRKSLRDWRQRVEALKESMRSAKERAAVSEGQEART